MLPEWLTPQAIELLWRGLVLTLVVTAITTAGSLLLGIFVGTMRLTGKPIVSRLSRIYIEIHRNIPALVLVIFWAFAVPNIFPQSLRQQIFFNNQFFDQISELTGISLPYYLFAGMLGLTLNTSGYLAELFRAGASTIPADQIDSARSLGASRWTIFWKILLPDGFRAAFPTISTRLIHNFKNTSLVSLVAVPVFFHGVQGSINKTFRATEFLLLAAVVYLILTALLAWLLRSIESRYFGRVTGV
ncbi:MAG: amino acid ABC transporter permease [Anaerolineae bacterium]